MARISILNRSSRHQRRWCSVPLDPQTDAKMPAPFCALAPGVWFVRGPAVGEHTVLWRLFSDVQPGEHDMDTATAKPMPADLRQPFQMSSWISDDLRGAVPYVRVTGALFTHVLTPQLVSFDGDDVKRTAYFRVSQGGWHLELWMDVWTMQDVVDFRGYVVWSDPNDASVRIPSAAVSLHCGERFVVHYTGKDNWHGTLYSGPVIDATPIPFRGAVLCAPTPNADATEQPDPWRMARLDAAAEGPVTATCEGFAVNKAWLAFGDTGKGDIFHDSERFLRGEPYREAYAERTIANGLVTGMTGSQPCFGATKWLPALLSGAALYELTYSADDYMLRCLHNREKDGAPVEFEKHPEWRTWSGATHDSSKDQLGKAKQRPYGWDKLPNGRSVLVDDQHRGDGPLLAAYALTGDPMLKRCLEDMLEVDSARAFPQNWRKDNPTSWFDAPRAGGRLLQSWAKMVRLLPECRDRLRFLAERELSMATAILDSRPGAVRWLQVISDARVLDPNRAPLCAVPWNEALWVLGAYEQHHAWKGIDDALSQRFLAFALRHAATILRYGTVRDASGALLPVNGVKVNPDGSPQPADYYRFPRPGASFQQGPGIDMLVGSAGWWSWFAGAVLCAYTHCDEADVQKLADEVVQRHYRNYRSVDELEWVAMPW